MPEIVQDNKVIDQNALNEFMSNGWSYPKAVGGASGGSGGVVARLDVVGDSLTLENGAFAKLQNAIINCQHASVYGFQEQDGMLGVYVFDIRLCVQDLGIVIYSKPFFNNEFTIMPDNTVVEGNLIGGK